MARPDFNYDLKTLKRELTRFYISADSKDQSQMLEVINEKNLEGLYKAIPSSIKMDDLKLGAPMPYEELADHLFQLSQKNNLKTSFIGDSIQDYNQPQVLSKILEIRNLTTAYTPYQPERSQGTLATLWNYSNALAKLTGFEAINASMYERSTCLYEAMQCALRIKRTKTTVLVSQGIHPNDREVIETLAAHTKLKIEYVKLGSETGVTDLDQLTAQINEHKEHLAAIVFAQVNHFGLLENVDLLTDLATDHSLLSIATFDPILLGKGGLKAPSDFGSEKQGVDIIVGEGQHLCLAPNFGGPGLGILGVRYNQKNKTHVRQTPGRYIGKTKDKNGKECYSIIMSTREQHIRRDKATSNICSNQSFIATLAGAALLARGDEGLEFIAQRSKQCAQKAAQSLCALDGVELAFTYSPFFNELTLKTSCNPDDLIQAAREEGLHLGVNVSERIEGVQNNYLKLSFSDKQSDQDIERLITFFEGQFKTKKESTIAVAIPPTYLRESAAGLKAVSQEELLKHYGQLGRQNISPDEHIYPLGSCTMKYNPYINDWAASLEGFSQLHPEAPLEDAQGSLEILYYIQEQFKAITGLAAVTTEPVAGAQGELVGLKMFQAYHQSRGEADTRNIVLIPRSAHGTNPATATMAGYESLVVNGQKRGIILLEADVNGEVDFEGLKNAVKTYGKSIAGMMVTNPNTAGIFESKFKEMAQLIHDIGGLVYMDGANMNAIAGHIDLDKMGVDAVHNNLHKTWTIPHGGGGPGDAIVAVSERLKDFLPGMQVKLKDGLYTLEKAPRSIGRFHRNLGNFAHKVRAYTYIKALGAEGVKTMSAVAVLASRYLYTKLKDDYPTLPKNAGQTPRMHEFIITLSPETFEMLEHHGFNRNQVIGLVGKLFLDFGLHAPTVSFPEPLGLMIEPTETYSKSELDHFIVVLQSIRRLIETNPKILATAPHFTPVQKVDELLANKNPIFSDDDFDLAAPLLGTDPKELLQMDPHLMATEIIKRHEEVR